MVLAKTPVTLVSVQVLASVSLTTQENAGSRSPPGQRDGTLAACLTTVSLARQRGATGTSV